MKINIEVEGLTHLLESLRGAKKLEDTINIMRTGEKIGIHIGETLKDYKKVKCQAECLRNGMEVTEAPVVITFTPGVDANHIQHPVKQIMYSAYLNGAYLPIISIPITYNTKVGSYQYHLKYFETGYIFKVADKLFMCRKGKENVYLIQIPKGLN